METYIVAWMAIDQRTGTITYGAIMANARSTAEAEGMVLQKKRQEFPDRNVHAITSSTLTDAASDMSLVVNGKIITK